jgi:glucose-6-phosphate-specific signal transduction histidine kinase
MSDVTLHLFQNVKSALAHVRPGDLDTLEWRDALQTLRDQQTMARVAQLEAELELKVQYYM